MFSNIKTKFKEKPTLFYALSICATWAGIGSLMNGVTMTQTYGIIPSIIWVLGNTIACIVFGLVAMKLPKVREVFGSSIMKWICGIMCVFQAWLSMNGMQTVFSDTILGAKFGIYLAYGLAIFFLIILLKFGMIRNVLTDGAGWIAVYLLAVFVTAAAAVYSGGAFNHIPMIADSNSMHHGIMKAVLLLPGPFTYPYFFEILHYNEKNGDGTKRIDVKKAFTLGGIFFGIYMAIVFPLAWVPIEKLHANDYNPNVVSEENLKLLTQSILVNGWTLPIVVRPDYTIIDGFHRWTVAHREPLKSKLGGMVPCVIVDHHGDESADVYGTITHNRARGEHLLEPMKAIVKRLLD